MKKRPAQKRLLHVLTLSLVIMLAGGGIALLYQLSQQSTSSYASSDNVVGPPSLPASYVDAVFQRVGSPMVGTGKAVEAASRTYNIDDAFALAVWWTETNDGAAGVGLADRNPGSVRGSVGYPSAYDGYTIYPSYTDAVNYWFYMMKKVYINRGLTTVYSISHPYVGTSTSDLWAGKVVTLMQKYRAEAPPPPTPTPTIAPDLKRQGQELSQDLQQQASGKSTYYPQVTPVAQPKTATSGTQSAMSGSTRTMVVLLVLALAVFLAAWAWLIGRRASRLAPQPAIAAATPTALSPWEQLRASGQQPASLFTGFNDVMRTTENLTPALTAQRTTETLMPTPAYFAHMNMETPPSGGAFAAEQTQFQSNPLSQPAWMGQQFSPLGASVAPEQQTTSAFAALLGNQPAFPASAFTTDQQAFPSGTFATGQQAFPSEPFAGEQLAFPSSSFGLGQQAFPSTTDALMGQPAFLSGAQTQGETQTSSFLRPGLAGLSLPAQSSPYRHRQQSFGASDDSQPQPVGAGSGGGLLSRYRAQNRQE